MQMLSLLHQQPMMISKMQCLERMILQPEKFKQMKLTYLLSPLLALLTLVTLSQAQGTSAAVTTTFSNMGGVNGELSSVVYSDRSGNPILKNSGFIAIGTFNLERAEIEALATAADLDNAFHQFGEATNFNSTENGAFQANASGNPAEEYDEGSSFDGAAVYLVIGDGSELATSSEFLVWKSDLVFDGSGPTGGPSELMLSVDIGDLIIGRSDKNTSDFSSIGGDAGRAAFTTVMIDSSVDDHGNSEETATFVAANSTTSGNLKDGDDVDFFRIDLNEDGNLFVKINQNLQLKLYNGEGVLLQEVQDAGDGLGGGVAADFMISEDLAAGTYFVSIAGDENTSDVGYNLDSEFEVKIIDLDPAGAGRYFGLVQNDNGRFVGHVKIVLSESGYYTGKIRGVSGFNRYFRGAINPDYADSQPINAYNQNCELNFQVEQVSDHYQISGKLHADSSSDSIYDFVLLKRIYDSQRQVPRGLRGRYTAIASFSTTSDYNLPAGDMFACGKLRKAGMFKIYGYSSSGSKFSYASPFLKTNKVPFFVRPKGGRENLTGDVFFMDNKDTDLSGSIIYRRKATKGSYYSRKFAKKITIEGSRYRKPSIGRFPLPDLRAVDSNAIAKFKGGPFGGIYHPVTWSTGGDIGSSTSNSFNTSARFVRKTGRFDGVYTANALTANSNDVTIFLRGVVLQKKGVVSGQAEAVDNGVGRFSIVPTE